ncbi:MAG: DUF697 domain-containing protein [Thiomargarita sp.]|nr:DUF697 domain-containing protein [Thiomargarita sp.]
MSTNETTDETQQEELTIKEKVKRITEAHDIVGMYSSGAMIAGLIPLPIIDMAALTGVQLKMLHSLSEQYEVEFSKDLAKPIIAALLGGALPITAAGSMASAIKIIPFIGQAAGMVSMSLLGSAATYAVGKVFIEHFESGGSFLTFDPQQMQEKFKKHLEEAKKTTTNS